MKIYKSISEFITWRDSCLEQNIGFVPTMGALHQGHLSLVEQSKRHCKKTVVSIFVNELQFAPEEDFKEYPRPLEADLKHLKTLKVDVVFLPTTQEMYADDFSVIVNELKISQRLEGGVRPGFFSGVTTVVSKLFNLVRPSHSYFGMKDIQQLRVIKKLVEDLNFNIQIIGCKTIREDSGLAMSSRNQYLSNQEKQEAAILYEALQVGEGLFQENKDYKTIKQSMYTYVGENSKIKIDYLSIAQLESFEELINLTNHDKTNVVISGAIFFNNVRLIDNIIIQ